MSELGRPTPRRRNSLYNADSWTDASGKTWRIEDMLPSHRQNLLAMLERRAEALLMAEAASCFMYEGGEMAEMDATRAGEELMDMDPLEWLSEQPLVKRLRELREVSS